MLIRFRRRSCAREIFISHLLKWWLAITASIEYSSPCVRSGRFSACRIIGMPLFFCCAFCSLRHSKDGCGNSARASAASNDWLQPATPRVACLGADQFVKQLQSGRIRAEDLLALPEWGQRGDDERRIPSWFFVPLNYFTTIGAAWEVVRRKMDVERKP